MMGRRRKGMDRRGLAPLLCVALLGAAAGGCAVADTGWSERIQVDMEALKRDVAAIKRSGGGGSSLPATAGPGELASLQRNMADLASESDRMKSDLLGIGSRTDETRLEMQKEVSRLNGITTEQGQAIQELRRKTAKLEEIEKRVASLEERAGKGAAPGGVAPPVSLENLKTPEEMYDYGLGLVKGGDTRKGREILSAFAAKYPNHRLMQNVHYWKGESFFAEKDYESAILSFQDVVEKYPGGEKAPDAMFKQGLSFQALNDKKNARILYELLLSKYPKAPAAEKARQKLAELK
jgi:tol-pal system protein YbgF